MTAFSIDHTFPLFSSKVFAESYSETLYSVGQLTNVIAGALLDQTSNLERSWINSKKSYSFWETVFSAPSGSPHNSDGFECLRFFVKNEIGGSWVQAFSDLHFHRRGVNIIWRPRQIFVPSPYIHISVYQEAWASGGQRSSTARHLHFGLYICGYICLYMTI